MRLEKTLLLFISASLYCLLAQAQLSNDGAVISLQKNSIVFVDGDIVHHKGSFESEGTLAFTANWQNLSGANVFTDNMRGTVDLLGRNQTLGGTASTNFGRLVFSGEGKKTLGYSQNVFDELNLGESELATENYVVHVQNSSPNAIRRGSGYISATEFGGLRRNTSLSQEYLFPMGVNQLGQALYRPAIITPNMASDNSYTVAAFSPSSSRLQNLPVVDPNSLIKEINRTFSHKVVRNEGNSSISLSVFYNTTSDGDFNTLANWGQDDRYFADLMAKPESLSPAIDGLNQKVSISQWNNFSKDFFILARTVTETGSISPPNVLTINQDGRNDMWRIAGIDEIPDNEVFIFNRWGVKVYQKFGYNNQDGWTAENLSAGTYFYTIMLNTQSSKPKVIRGFVAVLK